MRVQVLGTQGEILDDFTLSADTPVQSGNIAEVRTVQGVR
jgi:hypothetical protein